MTTPAALLTTAGAAALAAANAGSPLTITKIDVGQAVASPVAGQVVAGTIGQSSIAQLKYSATTDLLVSHNLSGKHIAIRFKIPAFSYGYFVLQFGIWSGATLLGVVSIPAVERLVGTGSTVYTLLLPVSDLNKVVKNASGLAFAAPATVASKFTEMSADLSAAFPVGPEGSVVMGVGSGNKQPKRLVKINPSVVDDNTEKDAEITRLGAYAGQPRTIYVLDSSTSFTQQPTNDWVSNGVHTDAALADLIGIGQFHHNNITGKTYFASPDKIRRVF